ncbi:transcriptional regulator with XRE-family HTH domain [Actinokineospora baliensis]|uniref:helix-turn-helix domain-containing protein n=1 Tax=Actinokineospora baliensis TaxID=547056 RepID=UPI00195930AE|nr:helix-turn-helix transcriptional regulator [Actinokineospora baliensis]MBM7771200.1 transcriptional regulator with XRE-family HTH domain [Actinokineospora baliensis]
MPVRSDPTVRKRRLGRELRRHRELAGKTHLEVSKVLGCSDAKISYMEAGRYKIQWRDVRDMLAFCGVDDPSVVEPLVQMARESGEKSWWQPYEDTMLDNFGTYVGLEGEAQVQHHFELHVIPGLLQTADYARALAKVGTRVKPDAVDRVVDLRLARQQRLDEPDPLELRLVIDEEALRRPIGGQAVLSRQLQHLLAMNERQHVHVQVLPTAVGAHAGLGGSFTILEFPDDPAVVYMEHKRGCLYLEHPDDVAAYTMTLDRLRADSLTSTQSAELIRRAIEALS